MSRVSATLKKALSFRAVEIALRIPQREDQRPASVEAFRGVPRERISERTEASCEDRHLQQRLWSRHRVCLMHKNCPSGTDAGAVCAQYEVPRARVQQLTAEQIWEVPQFREETVDEAMMVRRARLEKLTAELVEDVHQIRGETVSLDVSIEVGRFVLPERVSERISEQFDVIEAPKNSSQGSVEIVKMVPQE